jgi:hypothetical protein
MLKGLAIALAVFGFVIVFLGWYFAAAPLPEMLLYVGVFIGLPVLLLVAMAGGLWIALVGFGRVLRAAGWWRRS